MQIGETERHNRKLLARAKYNVMLVAPADGSWPFRLEMDELLSVPQRGVRCSLTLLLNEPLEGFFANPNLSRLERERLSVLGDPLQRAGWHVSVARGRIGAALIVDDSHAVFMRTGMTGGMSATNDRRHVALLVAEHQALMSANSLIDVPDELFVDRTLWIPSDYPQLKLAAGRAWDAIVDGLAAAPANLYHIDPRRFEELVAELLSRDGADVTLTPRTADGGRDVLASYDTPVGRHLYFVECKRFAPERKVGVELVRAFYGVILHDRATAGLLVTTSTFTRGALQFRDSVRNQIDLRGYDALVGWLRKYRSS